MSGPANVPQHEPTMEEILASIRKIISEDQPDAVKPAGQPAAAPRAAADSKPVAQASDADENADVLELTEEVHDDGTVAPVSPSPAPALENDIVFESVDLAPAPKAPAPVHDAKDEDLISDSTRNAVGRAFAHFDPPEVEVMAAAPSGTLDALFSQAIQNAFKPTLQQWIDNHDAEIMANLKPLIRAWMDEHLPPLIEAAVSREIGRAAANRMRKR